MYREHIAWSAYEFEFVPKHADWFWWLGFITLLAAGITIYLGNVLFAFVIVLCGVVMFLYGKKEPNLSSYEINKESITVSGKKYYYEDLASFAVDYESRYPKIVIYTKSYINSVLMMPLAGTKEGVAEEILAKHLEELPYQMPIADRIFEKINF